MEHFVTLMKKYKLNVLTIIFVCSMLLSITTLDSTISIADSLDSVINSETEDEVIEESTEEAVVEEKEETKTTTLPRGGVSIILDHSEDYDSYIEELTNLIAENTIIEEEPAPLYESIPKHSRWVGGTRLYIRTTPDNTSDDNIFDVLNPGQEVSITGSVGEDWFEIEYEGQSMYVMSEFITDIEPGVNQPKIVEYKESWDGTQLTKTKGRINGPSGSETYYNMDMTFIIARLQRRGYEGEYWIREDGCKMYGDYIILAADFKTRPIGTILETSLGYGIVADTGGFVEWNPTGIDIATNW